LNVPCSLSTHFCLGEKWINDGDTEWWWTSFRLDAEFFRGATFADPTFADDGL
jgi:hypothetical protein